MIGQDFYRFTTLESVSDWLKLHYTQEDLVNIANEVQDDESALSEYKGNYSRVINNYVRNGQENNQTEYGIMKMQEFLISRTIDDDIEVHRFVSMAELFELWKNTIKGRVYKYPCFLSTTMLKENYSMMEKRRCRVAISIRIRKGTFGTYIPEINSELPEFEILMPYRLKIKKINLITYEIII